METLNTVNGEIALQSEPLSVLLSPLVCLTFSTSWISTLYHMDDLSPLNNWLPFNSLWLRALFRKTYLHASESQRWRHLRSIKLAFFCPQVEMPTADWIAENNPDLRWHLEDLTFLSTFFFSTADQHVKPVDRQVGCRTTETSLQSPDLKHTQLLWDELEQRLWAGWCCQTSVADLAHVFLAGKEQIPQSLPKSGAKPPRASSICYSNRSTARVLEWHISWLCFHRAVRSTPSHIGTLWLKLCKATLRKKTMNSLIPTRPKRAVSRAVATAISL